MHRGIERVELTVVVVTNLHETQSTIEAIQASQIADVYILPILYELIEHPQQVRIERGSTVIGADQQLGYLQPCPLPSTQLRHVDRNRNFVLNNTRAGDDLPPRRSDKLCRSRQKVPSIAFLPHYSLFGCQLAKIEQTQLFDTDRIGEPKGLS